MRVLILVALLAAPANAGDLRHVLCSIRADNARLVMQHRQNGRDKFRLLRIVNISSGIDRTELAAFKGFIEDAYRTPRGDDEFDRREITQNFIEDAYEACLREH